MALCGGYHPKDEIVEGIKYDAEKPRFDLLCGECLFDVAYIMTFGAKKYADRNYLGLKWTRVFAAGMRHAWSWFIGKELDEETGKPHLAHAVCCFMMLYEMATREELDDRPFRQYAKNAICNVPETVTSAPETVTQSHDNSTVHYE